MNEDELWHSQLRILQRYNKEFNYFDIAMMCAMLRNGYGTFLYFQKGKREGSGFFYIKYANIPIKVCYSWRYNFLITVYPFDVDEYKRVVEEYEFSPYCNYIEEYEEDYNEEE